MQNLMEKYQLKLQPCGKWTKANLYNHLQAAVDLEFWTVPYYLTAYYSIVDQSTTVARLIRTVANQEMLHVQLATNLANAFGLTPSFGVPDYKDGGIPHLNFSIDHPDPRKVYHPYSADLGAFDLARINTMCLVEYPDWSGGPNSEYNPNKTEYGSIGDFYAALYLGVQELAHLIKGNRNQSDSFKRFYPQMQTLTITEDGIDGLPQARYLINAIVEQGEGLNKVIDRVPPAFQNQVDDLEPSWDHFRKFSYIREHSDIWPQVYQAKEAPKSPLNLTLNKTFAGFREILEGKGDGDAFYPLMVKLGADMLSCWQGGVIPDFGTPAKVKSKKRAQETALEK